MKKKNDCDWVNWKDILKTFGIKTVEKWIRFDLELDLDGRTIFIQYLMSNYQNQFEFTVETIWLIQIVTFRIVSVNPFALNPINIFTGSRSESIDQLYQICYGWKIVKRISSIVCHYSRIDMYDISGQHIAHRIRFATCNGHATTI